MKFRRTKAVLATCAVALLAAAVSFGATSLIFHHNSGPQVFRATLTSAACTSTSATPPNFSVCGPAVGTGPVLYPQAASAPAQPLPITFYNPLNVQLQVTSLTVTFTNTFPANCAESALRFNGASVPAITYSGTQPNVTLTFASPSPYLTVPAGTVSVPGSAVYNATLALTDNHLNQDACAGLALVMSYSATAEYTASTNTALTATPMSPAVAGQPVTLSATVSTSTVGATTPVGSVIFYSCSSVSCSSKTALGSALTLTASGVASTTTTPATTGTYYYETIYTPSNNTNFTLSTSNVVTRTVGYTNACGTSGKINGSYTVNSGQSIYANCNVNGAITVQSGGSFFLQGATVNGGVTSTSASSLMVCGSSINGGLTATGTTGFVLIGDGGDDGIPACAANSIKGGVTLTNGHGGFEIGGNAITGGVSVTNDTGAGPTAEDASPEIEGGTITGGLSCATSNVPVITDGGQKNTVTGTKSGECSGTGF